MSEREKKSTKNRIDIELSESVAEGTYANLAMIAYSGSEFVIDFIRLMPGFSKAKVKSRIVITPEHAKRLQRVLEDNLHKYEETFGTIKEGEGTSNFPTSFGPSEAEA